MCVSAPRSLLTDGTPGIGNRFTLAACLVFSALLSFVLLTVAGKTISKSRMRRLFKNGAISRMKADMHNNGDDAAVFLVNDLDCQGASGSAALTAVTAFGVPTITQPQPQPQPQPASAPVTGTAAFPTPLPKPLPPSAEDIAVSAGSLRTHVKVVYSGNGRLVCTNNVFETWVLTLNVKARNILAAEVKLSVVDKKELRAQTKRYQLKLSQRRFRERKRQRKNGLATDQIQSVQRQAVQRQAVQRQAVQLKDRPQKMAGSESPLSFISDDNDSRASHGSSAHLHGRLQEMLGSESPLSISSDGNDSRASHSSSAQLHGRLQEMLGSESPLSISSDGNDSCASHGSGLSADLDDLFTSEYYNDTLHVAQLPKSFLGTCRFTQSHLDKASPFEIDVFGDQSNAVDLPAPQIDPTAVFGGVTPELPSDVLQMLDAIVEKTGLTG